MEFIVANNIDIACLQEICHPIDEQSPLESLCKKAGYEYLEQPHYYYLPNNNVLAEAIVSRFPIIDSMTIYYNGSNYRPKNISETDLLGVIFDDAPKSFPGSRGIKHVLKSRCIINSLIKTDSQLLRLMTTHYHVSDLCTETIQMYEMSQLISSLVHYAKDLPTIFSADLNIRPQSYSVALLEKELTCHTQDFTDTLSKTHIAKLKDFPEGLAIDHVFSKGLQHISTAGIEIDFSEHQAIVSEFAIN